MAPEQARGAPPEPTQDLYAVGRVALELITGPAARRGSGEIPSHPLRPLVERLLVADPEQRLATADAALRLLRRLPVPPADPSAGARPARARRRAVVVRRPAGAGRDVDWPAWAAVVALVGVVAGCLCVLLGWSP